MIDDKIRTNVDSRSEQAEPGQVVQRAQQSETSAAFLPEQRAVPGRKPLFRN